MLREERENLSLMRPNHGAVIAARHLDVLVRLGEMVHPDLYPGVDRLRSAAAPGGRRLLRRSGGAKQIDDGKRHRSQFHGAYNTPRMRKLIAWMLVPGALSLSAIAVARAQDRALVPVRL